MMRALFLVLLVGCRSHAQHPQQAPLGESHAPGPSKPVESPSEGPQNLDVPISSTKPAEPAPAPSDPE